MIHIEKLKCTIDRLEIYFIDLNWSLVDSLQSMEWARESYTKETRRYVFNGKAFFISLISQNNEKFPYTGKIRFNPADHDDPFLFLQKVIGRKNMRKTRIYRKDPSVCIKKSEVITMDFFKNCTFISYQQIEHRFQYREKRNRGLIENFTIGGKKSRYVFYDLSLKYPVSNPNNHAVLRRKTGEISDDYICIEHQMKRNTLFPLGLENCYDLYKIDTLDFFKWLRFANGQTLIEKIKNFEKMDGKANVLAFAILQFGLHTARKRLNTSKNFDRDYSKFLKPLLVNETDLDLKMYLNESFKMAFKRVPKESITDPKMEAKRTVKSWADLKPVLCENTHDFHYFYE